MKYLIILLLSFSYSFAYVYDTVTDQCENYTLDSEIYLFDNNNGCVLTYVVNDIYYDARFFKTFQVTQALQCVNNTNTWYGSALIFDTANPLVCSASTTLNKTTCSCDSNTTTIDTNTTTTISNNTLGLTNNDYSFLMGLSGLLFGALMFFLLSNFLIGL